MNKQMRSRGAIRARVMRTTNRMIPKSLPLDLIRGWSCGFRTKIMRKKEGVERRKAHPAMAVPCEGTAARLPLFPPPLAGEGREGARSPSGAPRRRLPRRANVRTQPRPRFTRTKRDTQALPAPSFALKRSTPHPDRNAGGDDARTARERGTTLARGNRTRSMVRCVSRPRPSVSEIPYRN